MRIAHVSLIDLSSESGAVEHVLGIANGLAALGHEVHLLSPTASRPTNCRELPNLVFHAYERYGNGKLADLRGFCAHALTTLADVKPDFVYQRIFALDYLFFGRHLRRLGVPYACEINAITAAEYQNKGMVWRGRFYSLVDRYTFRRSFAWLPVTNEIRAYVERAAGLERPVMIASNGIAFDRINPVVRRTTLRQELGVAPETPIFVMAGFNRPWHGVDRAIEMMSKLPPHFQLWLIGAQSTADEVEVRRLAAEYGRTEAVRIFPWMPQAEVVDLVNAADVGIGALAIDRKMMSEAQALKVGLYLALGKPVILNHTDLRLDANLDFVLDLQRVNSDTLLDGVERLLKLRPEDHARIHTYAKQALSWDAVATQTARFLLEHFPG